jgi:hypothetical protein
MFNRIKFIWLGYRHHRALLRSVSLNTNKLSTVFSLLPQFVQYIEILTGAISTNKMYQLHLREVPPLRLRNTIKDLR